MSPRAWISNIYRFILILACTIVLLGLLAAPKEAQAQSLSFCGSLFISPQSQTEWVLRNLHTQPLTVWFTLIDCKHPQCDAQDLSHSFTPGAYIITTPSSSEEVKTTFWSPKDEDSAGSALYFFPGFGIEPHTHRHTRNQPNAVCALGMRVEPSSVVETQIVLFKSSGLLHETQNALILQPEEDYEISFLPGFYDITAAGCNAQDTPQQNAFRSARNVTWYIGDPEAPEDENDSTSTVLDRCAIGLPPVEKLSPSATQLYELLMFQVQLADVESQYPRQVEQFVRGFAMHTDEFNLEELNITEETVRLALEHVDSDAGTRINALIESVWRSWLTSINSKGGDPYLTEPNFERYEMSPFRQLVIRIIQGRQNTLKAHHQHGLYKFFTRDEDEKVWERNIDGVIGAINRESFQWE